MQPLNATFGKNQPFGIPMRPFQTLVFPDEKPQSPSRSRMLGLRLSAILKGGQLGQLGYKSRHQLPPGRYLCFKQD